MPESASASKVCPPSEAQWYVEMVIGQTFCPHGTTCRNKECARIYGTDTSSAYEYFKGPRPTIADRDALLPPGWSRLESTVTACEKD